MYGAELGEGMFMKNMRSSSIPVSTWCSLGVTNNTSGAAVGSRTSVLGIEHYSRYKQVPVPCLVAPANIRHPVSCARDKTRRRRSIFDT